MKRNLFGKVHSGFAFQTGGVNSSKNAVCFFHNSAINPKCCAMDGFDTTHSEHNGMADWRRKNCAMQQHPEHCTLLDQVFIFIT